MNTLVVLLAQDLLYVLVVIAGVVWLLGSRPQKAVLAAEAVLGLVVVGILIWVAGHLHTDPRPFVHDPASKPLFPHPADNGFPSDHSAAAGLLTALVFHYRRILGAVVAVGAALVAWARVAAHVHHGQDVVAGLAIGVVAAVLAIWLVRLLADELRRRGLTAGGSQARTTADRTTKPR